MSIGKQKNTKYLFALNLQLQYVIIILKIQILVFAKRLGTSLQRAMGLLGQLASEPSCTKNCVHC